MLRLRHAVRLRPLHGREKTQAAPPDGVRFPLRSSPTHKEFKYVGHAGRRDLPIVRDQRGKARPGDTRARFQVSLEVVGMNVH